MAIVQIEACVVWHYSEYTGKPAIELYPFDMSSAGAEYVFIGKQTLNVDVPDDFDPRPSQVENLRKKQQEILAEAQMKVTNIDEQIQRLLCIEAPKDDAEIIL